jgi:hypothetical protein
LGDRSFLFSLNRVDRRDSRATELFRLRGGWVVWLLALAWVDLSAAVYQADSWSVDVTVAPDKPAVMLGEPTWLSFTVRNLSEDDLQILVGGDYQNELGRPDTFQVKTVGRDGKWVSQPEVGLESGGLIGPRDLPAGGTHVFRLFVPHWAKFQEPGIYTISCRRTLQLLRPAAGIDFRKQATVDVITDARTTLEVQPPDDRRMGEVVQALGEIMLQAEGEKPGDEAVIALAWIDDARVVPYFRRALAIRSYALRFVAVQALAKFTTDEALAGLKAGLAMSAAEFSYAAPEKQPQLAANIRALAARALSRSQHPRARELLLAQRHDESENVRITVVRAWSRMPPAQALPILQEMTGDPSTQVSDEAKRYVSLLRRRSEARGATP